MRLVALILVLLGVGAAVSLGVRMRSELEESRGGQPGGEAAEEKQVPTGGKLTLGAKLETGGENDYLWLVVEPEQRSTLSTFTVEAEVEGEGLGEGGQVKVTALISEGWTFPFRDVKKGEDGKLKLRLAGVFVSRTAYELEGQVLLAGIPLKRGSGAGANINVLSRNTKFIGRDGKVFELVNKTAEITALEGGMKE